MNKWHKISGSLLILILSAHLLAKADSSSNNLLTNGSFDDPDEPLRGWKSNYSEANNKWYANNHKFVSVLKRERGHTGVLCLKATPHILEFAGTKVDSAPIPVGPGGRYKLTASARSTGAGCRILLEGYRWRPGIKPHKNPELAELRKCYKFKMLYFGSQETGGIASVPSSWAKASRTYPDKHLSKTAQKHIDKVQFLVVHIVAIGGAYAHVPPGGYYYFYLDDMELKRIN